VVTSQLITSSPTELSMRAKLCEHSVTDGARQRNIWRVANRILEWKLALLRTGRRWVPYLLHGLRCSKNGRTLIPFGEIELSNSSFNADVPHAGLRLPPLGRATSIASE
jgi:hypothetical protein